MCLCVLCVSVSVWCECVSVLCVVNRTCREGYLVDWYPVNLNTVEREVRYRNPSLSDLVITFFLISGKVLA